jgi:hypothetical protein
MRTLNDATRQADAPIRRRLVTALSALFAGAATAWPAQAADAEATRPGHPLVGAWEVGWGRRRRRAHTARPRPRSPPRSAPARRPGVAAAPIPLRTAGRSICTATEPRYPRVLPPPVLTLPLVPRPITARRTHD